MAESFVDSFKTELIADRIWHSRSQLELAIVEWVAWFNNSRRHQALDDIPPPEFEDLYAAKCAAQITLTTTKKTNQNGLRGTQPGSVRSRRCAAESELDLHAKAVTPWMSVR